MQAAAHNMRIVRYPSGHWAAIGAVPLGTSYFVIREIIDERPIRQEALRRVASVIAPTLAQQRARCGAIAGTDPDAAQREYSEIYIHAIHAIRRAAEAMIDRHVREELTARANRAMQHATNIADAIQQQTSPGPSVGVSAGQPAAQNIVQGIVRGDHGAISMVFDLIRRTQMQQQDARSMLQAVVTIASTGQASALALRSVFATAAQTMPIAQRLVSVLDQQVASQRQRQWERAQRT